MRRHDGTTAQKHQALIGQAAEIDGMAAARAADGGGRVIRAGRGLGIPGNFRGEIGRHPHHVCQPPRQFRRNRHAVLRPCRIEDLPQDGNTPPT
ncbi:MAG: hypothetical protein KGI94_14150 [Paracoccaceae bacterium]|nr:hypothetical protein [Paracoccaceae bacterium]